MLYASTRTIAPTKVLTRMELRAVLADLERRGKDSPNARPNEMIVQLACCCPLWVSEIAGLRLGDVRLVGARPHLLVRKELAKGRCARVVPLWWDAGTLAALKHWATTRATQSATAEGLFVGSLQAARADQPLSRHTLRKRFKTACRILGPERQRQLTIHHGRHTIVSLAAFINAHSQQLLDSANGSRQMSGILIPGCTYSRLNQSSLRRIAASRRAGSPMVPATI